MRNIVLVHGGFADGSGRRPLYDLLPRPEAAADVVREAAWEALAAAAV